MGSSPLTRGKPTWWRRCSRRAGLIPAHAGKTLGTSPAAIGKTAHPRSRGEKMMVPVRIPPTWGSSPLTRGKRLPERLSRHGPGLIPAHAGKTSRHRWARSATRAHPRSRGENGASCSRETTASGSSPLTRGKQIARRLGDAVLGLIPAHAGKTLWRAPWRLRWGDHPRSRGENRSRRVSTVGGCGSSPLTRGKPPVARGALLATGLIPAHAGKTDRRRRQSGRWSAHPRSRGENGNVGVGSETVSGSSPLTRGKRTKVANCTRTRGPIPTHAGKTLSRLARRPPPTAHPRSRGENRVFPSRNECTSGSSPLTRGKRLGVPGRARAARLIPAHAGKTQHRHG